MPNSSNVLRHMENHLALTTCEDIKNIMQPLLIKHGMTVFNYYRIYFDSTVIRLSTDQKWTEHYFKMNYLETLTIPESYLKKTLNYYLWLTDDCPLMLQDAAINFDMANGISIAKINHDSIEYFCFASTRDNTSIVNNFYLNNLDVLEQYSLYFKD
ncbi:TPA: LuxR family transcriptional regulator, partial [Legionella pneumophila]